MHGGPSPERRAPAPAHRIPGQRAMPIPAPRRVRRRHTEAIGSGRDARHRSPETGRWGRTADHLQTYDPPTVTKAQVRTERQHGSTAMVTRGDASSALTSASADDQLFVRTKVNPLKARRCDWLRSRIPVLRADDAVFWRTWASRVITNGRTLWREMGLKGRELLLAGCDDPTVSRGRRLWSGQPADQVRHPDRADRVPPLGAGRSPVAKTLPNRR